MDIRIGNDICVQIPISEFGPIDPDNIKEVRCAFINQKNTWPYDYEFHPAFHCSTQYTIRSCGHYSYNVHPHNMHMHCMNNDPHCGSVVCNNRVLESRFDSYCNVSNNYVNAYFPAEFQKDLGSYKCVFEIKVAEEGWDCDDLHTYTTNYEHVFDLKNNGVQGRTIIINPVNDKNYDTYLYAATEEELLKYEGDYTKLIPMAEGFRFSNLPGFKKSITISDDQKKIIVISVYDSLQFKVDSYMLPMTMLDLGNGYYVYISDDLYSNRFMNIQMIDTKYSNPVEERGEWFNVIENDRYNISSDKTSLSVNGGTVKLTITRSYDLYKKREITVNGEHVRYDKQLIQSYKNIAVTNEVRIVSNTGIDWTGILTQGYRTFSISANTGSRERIVSFTVYIQGSSVGTISLTQNSAADNPGGDPGTDDPTDDPTDNPGDNPGDDPTDNPGGDDNPTDNPGEDSQVIIAYVGQMNGQYEDLYRQTAEWLIQNSEPVYTKRVVKVVEDDIFYALINSGFAFGNITFRNELGNQVITEDRLEYAAKPVTINGSTYWLYSFRNWPPSSLIYTLNVK